MRIKKGEVPWSRMRFESKTRANQLYDAWCLKVLALPWVTKRMHQVRVKKVFFFLELWLTRHHEDLELLVWRWSC